MNSFFRQIRLKFLSQNNFTKYLIYAIGEIIIIMIGIFIAVQINNWNENRIIAAKEQINLKRLKIEFEKSQSILEEIDLINKGNITAAKQLANFFTTINLPENEEISKLLDGAFRASVAFNPQNSLLNEMISTGSLKDISNNKLRELLASWESSMKAVQGQENLVTQERQNALNRIREYGSIRTIFDETGFSKRMDLNTTTNHFSNQSLLKSTQFENDLLLFIVSSSALDSFRYKETKDTIIQILELLESEIKE